MATIATLRSQVAALVAAAQPRPGRPHRRTTAEGRQELARILDKIESLPADAPVYPEGLADAYAEIDRVLARLDPVFNQIAGNSAAQSIPQKEIP